MGCQDVVVVRWLSRTGLHNEPLPPAKTLLKAAFDARRNDEGPTGALIVVVEFGPGMPIWSHLDLNGHDRIRVGRWKTLAKVGRALNEGRPRRRR